MVRWNTATRMFAAWGLTLPADGAVGGVAALCASQGGWGVPTVAVIAIVSCAAIWAASRRKPVDHTNVNDIKGSEAGVVTDAVQSVSPPPAGAGVRARC